MSEVCTNLNNNSYPFDDKIGKDQNIDIVDFQTVSFDKKQLRTKRSLSLNIYKYEKMLGTKDFDNTSLDTLKEPRESQQKSANNEGSSCRSEICLSSFGLVLSVGSFMMMAVVVFFVVANRTKGNMHTFKVG